MKKCCIALLLLLYAGFSLYAQSSANVSIFFSVSGFGRSPDENSTISTMLTNELTSRKYTLLNAPQKANFTLHGLLDIFDEYDDYGSQTQSAATYTFNALKRGESFDELYVFQLTLTNVKTGEVVLQNVIYASFDDVYNFFPVLMHNLSTHMSGSGSAREGSAWKNKWINFRASFDYPITFYYLQPDGLIHGISLHNPNTNQLDPQEHKVIALPGATLGAEFQLLNFLSLELNFQLNMGDTRDNAFVNTAAGMELKVPIKRFDNIMLLPYGAFSFPLNVSPVFSEFPNAAAGGGIQLCTRAGKRGAFFVDVNYMFSFSDAVMHNPYGKGSDYLPEVIHYKRSQLGIGLGYKFGILDRQTKTVTITF